MDHTRGTLVGWRPGQGAYFFYQKKYALPSAPSFPLNARGIWWNARDLVERAWSLAVLLLAVCVCTALLPKTPMQINIDNILSAPLPVHTPRDTYVPASTVLVVAGQRAEKDRAKPPQPSLPTAKQ